MQAHDMASREDLARRESSDQTEVIAFLGDPAAYDPPPDTVERIDTHGAIVFLAGDQVYKIKRAVRLPYLDFSTLEKRRRVSERELEINRRTAPEIYLGVVPIVRTSDGRLALGGPDEPVEWAVHMRRFDQDLLFDRLAEAGRLDLELMAPLAEAIAAAQTQAPKASGLDGATVLAPVMRSTSAALAGAAPLVAEDEAEAYARTLEETAARLASLLRRRADAGFVRRCHGDLHLQNIVLLDGRPTLFDAIEFDEAIATIDLLYDLAFLLMDLWGRGLRRHANAVLNCYLHHFADAETLDALAALPFFLACRAAVRAMVTLDRLPHVDAATRAHEEGEIKRYAALARRFLAPPPPRLIVVAGLSGTGKSTLAAGLAPDCGPVPGAVHLRSDLERKRLCGADPLARLGPECYTGEMTHQVYETLARKAQAALTAGHSVILDAVSAQPGERDQFEQAARAAGAAFSGLWLSAPRDTLVARVEGRRNDASDADAGVVARQLATETGPITWPELDASGSPEEVLARAREMLGPTDPPSAHSS